jgi:cobalt-zinc-cadmium resistance protein CzcA
VAVPVALLLIFALLFLTFSSAKLATLIFLNVPIAATGGILALWLRGIPFSISAGVGFIALFGVAVLNGVVLINTIVELRRSEHALSEAVFQGSVTRMRPVLMTALVAILGFVPMALSTSAGAEVQRPLATVVIGGLITSTLLTLFVLPAIYRFFEPRTRTDASSPEAKLKGPHRREVNHATPARSAA